MLFKVHEIGENGLPVEVSVTDAWLSDVCNAPDLRVGGRGVRVKGELRRMGDDILLRATVKET